jgi:cytochrome c2
MATKRSNMLGKSEPRLAAAMAVLVAAGLCQQVQAADPAAGKAVFGSVCSICHSAQPGKNRVGSDISLLAGKSACQPHLG